MDELLDELRERYASLLDAMAVDPQLTEDIDPDQDQAELRAHLRQVFTANPGVDRLRLRVHGTAFGIATRARADRRPGSAGASEGLFDVGSSDGATLPGSPTHFRLVRYACPGDGCSHTADRSFHDERFVPVCSTHGRMELTR